MAKQKASSTPLNEKDQKLFSDFLKEQSKARKQSINDRQQELDLSKTLQERESEILDLLNKRKSAASEYNDYARMMNNLLKDQTREQRIKYKDLVKEMAMQKKSLLNEMKAYDVLVERTKKEKEHYELMKKATHKADELVEKYEEQFDSIGEINDLIKKMPGGGLLTKILGTDKLQEKIQKQVTDQLVNAEVAGKGLASAIGKAALYLAAFAAIVKFIEWFSEIDSEVSSLAKNLDVSRHQAAELVIHSEHIAESMRMTGIRGEQVQATIEAIRDEMGSIALATDEGLVKNITLAREKLGLTNEEALALNSTATILGTTMETLSAEAYALGDGLIGGKKTLKELAKLPKSLIIGFRGTTKELSKAVVKGKLLGLSLEQVKKSGEGMLDIQSSIEKEMVATALTGKRINLNAARQYYYTGQYAKLQDEILNIAGSLDEYTKMGPLQQRAMADALEMNVDEYTEMLVKAEELKKVGLTSARAEELMSLSLEEQQKTLASMGAGKQRDWLEQQIKNKKQEEVNEKFKDAMSKIADTARTRLLPVVETISDKINTVADFLANNASWLGPLITGAGALAIAFLAVSTGAKMVKGITSGLSAVKGLFGGKTPEAASSATESADQVKGATQGKNKVSQLLDGIKNIVDSIKGVVQSAIQFVKDVGKDLINTVKDLFNGIIDLVRSVGSNVLSTLQELIGGIGKTFQSIIKFIKDVGTDLISTVKDLLNSVVDLVRSVGTNVLSTLQELIGGIGKILADGTDIIVNVGSKLAEGAMKILNIIIKGLGQAAGQLPAIMSALGSAVVAFFTPMAALVPLAPAIAIFTLAMIGLGYAFKLLGEGIGAAAPGIEAFFNGIGTVIESVGTAISKVIETITTSIIRLQDINPLRLIEVAGGIVSVGAAIAGFGAGAGAGGVMSAIGSFFDEDPTEKFNRFATIDSAKLVEVASAIDKLGNAIANFSSQVGKIGEVSGIIKTIDKVMELHDAVTKNPIEEAIEGVGNAVGDIFSKAVSFVTSIPTADTVNTSGVATSTDSATSATGQGSLSEVAKLLKELIAKVDQPVSININGRVMDEIEKQTTLRKTYSTKVDGGYGTFG